MHGQAPKRSIYSRHQRVKSRPSEAGDAIHGEKVTAREDPGACIFINLPGYSGERRREEDATHAQGDTEKWYGSGRDSGHVCRQVKEGPAKGTVDVHSRHT